MNKKSMKVSTDEKATMLTLYPERVKGAEILDKSLQGVADYILNTNTLLDLNDKNEVVRVADKILCCSNLQYLAYDGKKLRVTMLDI